MTRPSLPPCALLIVALLPLAPLGCPSSTAAPPAPKTTGSAPATTTNTAAAPPSTSAGATTGATNAGTAPAPKPERGFDLKLVADPRRPAPFDKLRLPPGFTISYFAKDVPHARSMARGPRGTIFVGTRQTNGSVYALTDADGDGVAEKRRTIATGLNMPNGVAVHDGALYVAEVHRILRFDQIESRLDSPPKPRVIAEYPKDRHHGWKFIRFGPDGKLYVPVGAPCNVCSRQEPIYASITRIDPDGKNRTIVARGVRNSVGFDWHPTTKHLWFTDNGRDHLGDNSPPCELNHLKREGQHFGFPFCHGTAIRDPEFGHIKSCTELTPAAQELGPHVAPLGMRFYTGRSFPRAYHHQIFIAEHGSWNRSTPIGYRVSLVQLGARGEPIRYDTFADGWLQPDGKRLGRPVDVMVMPDGALLVSDDYSGAIYRIQHKG